MFKRKISVILAIALLLTTFIRIPNTKAFEQPLIRILVDGQQIEFPEGQTAINNEGSIMAPINAIAEKAFWHCENGIDSIKIISSSGTTVEAFAGVNFIKVNDIEKNIEKEPFISDNLLLLPVEDIAKAFNCQVEKDIATNDLYILTPSAKIFTDKYAVVPELANKPLIDGSLNEECWENAALLDDFMTVYYGKPANPPTSFKLLHDENSLYLGIECENPEELKPGDFQGVEILFKTSPSDDNYYYIPLITSNVAGSQQVFSSNEELQGATRIEFENYTVHTNENNGVWTAELLIPFEGLGASEVEPGEEWLFNVITHRSLVKPMNSWVPILHAFFWDRTGEFYKVTSDIIGEGRLGSIFFTSLPSWGKSIKGTDNIVTWELQDLRLEYIDFLNKALSFKESDFDLTADNIELVLVDPNGVEEYLEISLVDKVGERNIITFKHPDMEKTGIYQLRIIASTSNGIKSTIAIFDRESVITSGNIFLSNIKSQNPNNKIDVELEQPSLEAQKIIDMIPDKTGFRFCGLPSQPDLRPDNLFNWSDSNPDVLVGKKDGMVYPNESYPYNGELIVKNQKGENVIYPYYEDQLGKKYFIEAHINYKKLAYVLTQTKEISLRNPMDAAWILYEFAEKYEGYVPTHDAEWRNYLISLEAGPPYSYWGGMWERWFWNDLGRLNELVNAFMEINKTSAFEKLSDAKNEDVERRIIEKMFKPSVDYVLSIFQGSSSNMMFNIWNGLISLGKALQEPDYIHKVAETADLYARNAFLSDGYYKEVTGSYHKQSLDGFTLAADSLKGWYDPEVYISPRTGKKMEGYNVAEAFPVINKALDINSILCYPDKKLLPIMDTWPNDKVENVKDVGSVLMPATKIGKMVRGQGMDQTQLYVMFQPKYGHIHNDFLNINLYSLGQELLPDIGYTYTKHRSYLVSTLAHNTVVVDAKDGDSSGDGKHGGNVEVFATPSEDVQVMRASYNNAYAETEEYRREPWLIGFDEGDGSQGYVVDIFRVKGGSRHEYTLQADANHDSEIDTAIPLEAYGQYLLPSQAIVKEAKDYMEESSAVDSVTGETYYSAYVGVRDVKSASVSSGEYALDMKTKGSSGETKAALKVTGFVEGGDNTLFVGKSPSIRDTRLYGKTQDTNDKADKYFTPKYVLRREGENLESTFVTVIEPYMQDEGSNIQRIEHLIPDEGNSDDAVIEISYGDTTDIILSSTNPEKPLIVGDITLMGNMGFIRIKDGEIKNMYLIGGTLLKKGNTIVAEKGSDVGKVKKVLRTEAGDEVNGFITDTTVNSDMKGCHIVIKHPDGSTAGYKIKDIVSANNETVIDTGDMDPGFVINGDGSSEMKFLPFKRWYGETTFKIENTVEFLADSAKFFDINGKEVTSLPDSGYIKTSVNIKNNSYNMVPVKFLAVLKNAGGSVYKILSIEKQIKAGNDEIFSAEFDLPVGNDIFSLEVYLWDNMEGMKPITKSIRIMKKEPPK